MLVLSRKSGETIHIGSDIVVTILDVSRKFTRIGISAPKHICILRGEVKEQIEQENKLAATQSSLLDGLIKLGSLWHDDSEADDGTSNR
ncbi:carbon storage regulator CsrA [bacterium]|nr:carbon storage regulator CsrA [bacterium]